MRLLGHADASGVLARGLSDLEVRRLGPKRGKAPVEAIAPSGAEGAVDERHEEVSQIPGVRASGETLISRFQDKFARPKSACRDWLSHRYRAGLIKRPFCETVPALSRFRDE